MAKQQINNIQSATQIIGSATATTAVSGITSTDTTVVSVSVTITAAQVASGKKFKVKGQIPQIYSSVTTDRARVTITDGTTILQRIYSQPGGSASGWPAYIESPPMSFPSAGTYTYRIQVARDQGTGTIVAYADAVSPSPIWIEVRME